MNIDLAHLQEWIGRTETFAECISPAPLRALAATLDRDDPPPRSGDELPPCWHWLFFLPTPRQSELGSDGHPRRGAFLPPVPLTRRMWAGSRLCWNRPLRVAGSYVRSSRIASVDCKAGQTGPLVFVQVHHEVRDESGIMLCEEQDLVFRDPARPGGLGHAGEPATASCAWSREVSADPTMLLRYSALTFNGHRIHYDRGYATEQEGYPGLVVHGPLLATLLLDLLRRHVADARVETFSFRAVRPTFDTAPFTLCGACGPDDRTVNLWVRLSDGSFAMKATAELA